MTRERLYSDIGQETDMDIVLLSGSETNKANLWVVVDRRSREPRKVLFKEYKDSNPQTLAMRANRARRIVNHLQTASNQKKMADLLPGRPLTVVKSESGGVGVLIPHILDHGVTQEVSGSTNELVRPDSLERLKQKNLKLPELARRLRIAAHLAMQTSVIHHMGLVHGDLAPRNVLLQRQPDGNLEPVIIDLDNAALRKPNPDGGYLRDYAPGMKPLDVLSGAIDFELRAPELANRGRLPSEETDLWSLATMLYSILMTPRRPFTLYQMGTQKIQLDAVLYDRSLPWPPRNNGVVMASDGWNQLYASREFLGQDLIGLFARVFDRPSGQVAFSPSTRPLAWEWAQTLDLRSEWVENL